MGRRQGACSQPEEFRPDALIEPFFAAEAKKRQGARTDIVEHCPTKFERSRDQAAAAVGRAVCYWWKMSHQFPSRRSPATKPLPPSARYGTAAAASTPFWGVLMADSLTPARMPFVVPRGS